MQNCYFNNIFECERARELESTLTDSSNLPRVSAFILNVPLIEISVCIPGKPNSILLKRSETEYRAFSIIHDEYQTTLYLRWFVYAASIVPRRAFYDVENLFNIFIREA